MGTWRVVKPCGESTGVIGGPVQVIAMLWGHHGAQVGQQLVELGMQLIGPAPVMVVSGTFGGPGDSSGNKSGPTANCSHHT